jgi:WD40 repeat protein
MGVVYEAVQESLGRRVAVKVLPADRCRGAWAERFRREAQAAARLHHTNIVPVFGVGRDGDTHFYVMQYIAGHGLDRVLDEARRLRQSTTDGPPPTDGASAAAYGLLTGRFSGGPPPVTLDPPPAVPAGDGYVRTVARLGGQAAGALHHAHTLGVLHRDVKPSNLLLDAGGTVWVADFGLAKAVAPDAADGPDPHSLTETGDLVGTLRYMAPERFRGECDARSDVYALGATLYELLALRPAFDDPDRLRLVARIARGDPPPLRRLNPRVPRDLDTVVRKAMARRPADRYPSAAALADDLGRFLAGRPVAARRASAAELAWRWARRRPAVAALSAAVLLLAVTAAGGGWWAAGELRRQVGEVSQAKRDTTDRLWDARLAEARAVRVGRRPGQRVGGLRAVAEAAAIRPAAELRTEAAACLALYDLVPVREWDERLENARLVYSTGAAFDPPLDHYAVTDGTGAVTVHATADGRAVARLPGPGVPADYLRFSPDGRYLAARHTGGGRMPLAVWDWRAGRVVVAAATSPQQMLSLDFHPNGREMAVGGGRGIDRYRLPDGARVGAIPLPEAAGWLAFEPGDGGRLAVACGKRVRVVGWDGDRAAAATDDLPADPYAVAWCPGRDLLAVSAPDGNVYTFEPDAGRPRAVLRGHQLQARELAFTPDGAVLVTRGWDATTRLWDPVEGRELLRVRGASFLQVSADGRRVGYRGYTAARLGVWDLVGGDVCRVLYGPAGAAQQVHGAVAFSPDGSMIAAGGGTGLTTWDADTGRPLDHRRLGVLTDVRFDPAGRWLYTAGPTAGCRRLPLARDADGRPTLGPAEAWIGGVGQPFRIATDRAGEVTAVVDRFRRVAVARPGGPTRWLPEEAEVSFAAVSPDGRWVATGPQRGSKVRVRRAADGAAAAEFPSGGTSGVTFTPDGGRLIVTESDGAYRIYSTDGWRLLADRRDPDAGFTRGMDLAIHPAGRLAAHAHDRVGLRLTDLDTGEGVILFQVPDSHNLAGYAFSPDGRRLAAVTVQGAVQLWDLARLREELRGMRLDWPDG